MKVTTELKNLIKRSFDEKRTKVTNEFKAVANEMYEQKRKEVEDSKEFKDYLNACKALYERFEEDCKSQGNRYDGNKPFHLCLNKDIKIENIVNCNVDSYVYYNKNNKTNLNNEKQKLDLAQESLMIKLTYEKDLNTIREMLAEYDITI